MVSSETKGRIEIYFVRIVGTRPLLMNAPNTLDEKRRRSEMPSPEEEAFRRLYRDGDIIVIPSVNIKAMIRDVGILNKYDYYAVANICTEQSSKITTRSIKNVYHYLRQLGINAKSHIFGLKIASLESVERYIHSFDSMAWTRPTRPVSTRICWWLRLSDVLNVLRGA